MTVNLALMSRGPRVPTRTVIYGDRSSTILGTGDYESALLVFDRAVGEGLPSEKNTLSLIKVRTCHSRLC